MSINLPHIEGTSEKLHRILRSRKIRSTSYTERPSVDFLNQKI